MKQLYKKERPAHLSIVERLGGFQWCKGTKKLDTPSGCIHIDRGLECLIKGTVHTEKEDNIALLSFVLKIILFCLFHLLFIFSYAFLLFYTRFCRKTFMGNINLIIIFITRMFFTVYTLVYTTSVNQHSLFNKIIISLQEFPTPQN